MNKMLVLLTAIILMSGCINYSVNTPIVDTPIVDPYLITSEEMWKMLPTLSDMPTGTILEYESLYDSSATRRFLYDNEHYNLVVIYVIFRYDTVEETYRKYDEVRSKYPLDGYIVKKNTLMIITIS